MKVATHVRHSPVRWLGMVAAGSLLLATLVACGGGGGLGEMSGAPAADSAGSAADSGVAERRSHQGSAPNAGANRPSVQTRAVIRSGSVRIVVKDLTSARDEVEALLDRYGGFLDEEETTNDAKGRPSSSRLVLRVPEPEFGTVMTALTKVGRTQESHRSSEDVTTEVIDVDSRVATQEASLERLRDFLRKATTVDDMIRLESEIAMREAELESLKSQQAYLADQTALSTITVHLTAPPRVAPPEKSDDQGFLVGLKGGWEALTVFLLGLATLLGALLPFAVALALVGVPTWLLVRALARRRGPAGGAERPTSTPEPPGP